VSIHFSCDGCGKTGDDFASLGAVIKVHYCGACKTIAETYLKERDAIRSNLVQEFNARKSVLVARFAVNGFRLPDEPAV
jgi:hypothetical protein